jgi:hypothetical protein
VVLRRNLRSPRAPRPEAPGRNCSVVWHPGVNKFVDVKPFEAQSAEVLKCQCDVA